MRTLTRIVCGILALTVAPAGAVVIDEFTTNQATVSDPAGAGSSVTTGGADIIGQRRDLLPTLLEGAGPVSLGVGGGLATFTVADTTPNSRGQVTITWDSDSDPNVLDPTGLGSEDLTTGNHTGFAVVLNSATAGTELVFVVHTDASNASRAARRLPLIAAPTTVFVPFSAFQPISGTGADFTDVGAIELIVRATEGTATLDLIETRAASAATLVTTKVDLDTSDAPIGATPQAPGTTLRYRVTVTNSGSEALAVNVEDTLDANLSLVADSLDSTPIAREDQYGTSGNVGLNINAAAGLLANDSDPDGDAVSVTTLGPIATALGGTATVAADGSFSYQPLPGLGTAVDTFSYTISDGGTNTASAIATIHIGPRIWFVDNNHCGPAPCGTGTFANPFGSLVQAQTASFPRDTIFLFTGSAAYPGGITLKNRQRLIGQGVALEVDGVQLVAAGSAPSIVNSAGAGVTLAQDNTLRGFGIGNTSGPGISGTTFGTLTLTSVSISGTGAALALTTGTVDAVFGSISSATAGARAVDLTTVDGSLSATSTTISDPTTHGIRIATSPGLSTSWGPTTITDSALAVAPLATGIEISGSAGAATSFASLAITSDGPGLVASGSGTLNIGGAGNSISATGGAAIHVTSMSLGTGGNFSTVSSTNSAGKGVNLDAVTGGFTATGGSITGSADNAFDVNAGSGPITYAGGITNPAGRAVEVTGRTTSAVILSGSISDSGSGVNIASNSGGTVTLSGSYSGTAATSQIDVANNSGSAVINFSGSSKTLSTGANNAIDITSNGTAQVNFTGGGLVVTTTSGIGFNATGGAGGVTVQGSGNTITSTTGRALNVVSTAIGALDMTFQRISSGVAAGSGPVHGINLDNTGTLGGLVVTGTGGSCTFATPTCSGGTIQSSTGDAVRLVSTRDVSLTRMRIHDNDTNGIYGDELTNFSLADSVVTDNDVANPSAFEAGIKFNELYGTNSISNTVVRGTKGDNIRLEMASGTLNNLTLTGVTVGPTANVGGGFSNGFSIVTSGNPTLNVTVTGSLFTGVDATKQMSSGILTSIGGGTTTLTVTGSDFEHSNVGIDIGSSSTGIHRFNIDNNDVIFQRTNAINVVGSSVMDGTLNNNRVGNATLDSGSMNSFGIGVSHRGNSNWFLALTNNTVRNSDFEGIFVRTGDLLAADNGTVHLTLVGNTVFPPDDNSGFPANPRGMALRSRQATTLCMNIVSNEAQGNGAAGYHLQESDTSQLRFQNFNTNAVTTLTANGNTTGGGPPTTNEVGAPFAGGCTATPPSFP